MPVPISDDGISVTFQLEDGQTVRVPKDVAQSVAPGLLAGAPVPPLQPAPQPVAPLVPQPLGGMGPMATPGRAPAPEPAPKPPQGNPWAPPGQPQSTGRPPGAPIGEAGAKRFAAPGQPPGPSTPEASTRGPGRRSDQVEQFQDATDLEVQGNVDIANAQERGLGRQELLYTNALGQEKAFQKEWEDKLALHETDMAHRQARQADLRKKYAEAKVDPRRVWNQMSTGNEVLAWVGVALSGLGNAFKGQGGQNQALDMIQGAIDRDVQLQMAEIDKLGQEYAMGREEMKDASELFNTRLGQAFQLQANRWNAVGREFEAIGLATNKEEVAGRAKIAAGQAYQKSAEFENRALNDEREFGLRKYSAEQSARQGWANINLRKEELQMQKDENAMRKEAAQREAAFKQAPLAAHRTLPNGQTAPVTFRDGSVWMARNDKAAEEVATAIEGAENGEFLLNQLHDSGALDRIMKGEATSEDRLILWNYTVARSNATGQGVVRETDYQAYAAMNPEGLAREVRNWVGGNPREGMIANERAAMNHGVTTKLKAKGINGWDGEYKSSYALAAEERERTVPGEEIGGTPTPQTDRQKEARVNQRQREKHDMALEPAGATEVPGVSDKTKVPGLTDTGNRIYIRSRNRGMTHDEALRQVPGGEKAAAGTESAVEERSALADANDVRAENKRRPFTSYQQMRSHQALIRQGTDYDTADRIVFGGK